MGEMIFVEGMEGVKASLLQLDAKIQKQAMRHSLRDAGQVMKAAVEEGAPVREMPGGNSLPSGALKSDITLRVYAEEGQMVAVVQPGKLTRQVARWVEYGHRLVRGGYSRLLKNGRARGPGKKVGNVEAHPFIRPAFESSERASVTAFVETLKSEIRKRG